MRFSLCPAGIPVTLLLGLGALLCAAERRDAATDLKAKRAKRREQERELADAAVRLWLLCELIEGRLSLTQATDEFMKFD